MIAPEILAIAETLNLCLPPPPDQERVVNDRFAAFIDPRRDDGPHNVVQRVRVAPEEVDALVDEVRALFRSRNRSAVTWEVGPSSAPADLYARLTARGMKPDAEPTVAGMVLQKPLAAGSPRVEVRRASGLDDFAAHGRIYHRCFGSTAPAPTDEELAADFERRRGREDHLVRYLAIVDGAPVAAADAILVENGVVLSGGATLPEARGKGCYQALVAARWEEALRRGTPALVVQAGSMSRPILERLGFETVATLHVLLDRLG